MKGLTFILLGLLIASGACDTVVDECGPFHDRFKTIGFATAGLRIVSGDSPTDEPILTAIENDTLSAGEFAIRMVAQQKLYSSSQMAGFAISLVPAAYACSPPVPSSDEVIRDIEIYSNKAFNGEYSVKDNLADEFDVIVLNRSEGLIYERIGLNHFLEGEPGAVDEMIVILKSAPREASKFRFTIKYSQEGKGVGEYEFTTNPVVLESAV